MRRATHAPGTLFPFGRGWPWELSDGDRKLGHVEQAGLGFVVHSTSDSVLAHFVRLEAGSVGCYCNAHCEPGVEKPLPVPLARATSPPGNKAQVHPAGAFPMCGVSPAGADDEEIVN